MDPAERGAYSAETVAWHFGWMRSSVPSAFVWKWGQESRQVRPHVSPRAAEGRCDVDWRQHYSRCKLSRDSIRIAFVYIFPFRYIGHQFQSATSTKCDTAYEHNSRLPLEDSTGPGCGEPLAASDQPHWQCWRDVQLQVIGGGSSHVVQHLGSVAARPNESGRAEEEANRWADEEPQYEKPHAEPTRGSRSQLLHPKPQAHLRDVPTHQQPGHDEVWIHPSRMLGALAQWSARAVYCCADTVPAIKRQGEAERLLSAYLMKILFNSILHRFLYSRSTKTSQWETARREHFHTNNVQ